jgi:hypothetical protein
VARGEINREQFEQIHKYLTTPSGIHDSRTHRTDSSTDREDLAA